MNGSRFLGDHAVSPEIPVSPSLRVHHHHERESEENELAPNEMEQDVDGDMAGADRGEYNEEEGRGHRVHRVVQEPSAREVELHNKTHFPFRSWCRACVAGRRANHPHRPRGPQEEGQMPEVHMGYFFPKDAIGEPTVTCIAVKHRSKKYLGAHVLQQKGGGSEHAVQQVVRDLRRMGEYGPLTLRGDQEHAIQEMLRSVARARGAVTTNVETVPRGDSQANGRAEQAVQMAEGIIRVHKIALENMIEDRVSVHDACFPWLVENAADCYNKFHVGPDGKTAYEHVRGRPYRGEVFAFGTPVLHRVVGHVQGADMRERWLEGIYLGKQFASDEFLVSTTEGEVVRARAVLPRPGGVKLTKEMLDKIKGSPWNPTGVITHDARVLPPRGQEAPQGDGQGESGPAPRGVRITNEVLERFGFTPLCPRCQAIQRGDPHRSTHHSRDCRRRLEEAMEQSESHARAVENAAERKRRYAEVSSEQDTTQEGEGGAVPEDIGAAQDNGAHPPDAVRGDGERRDEYAGGEQQQCQSPQLREPPVGNAGRSAASSTSAGVKRARRHDEEDPDADVYLDQLPKRLRERGVAFSPTTPSSSSSSSKSRPVRLKRTRGDDDLTEGRAVVPRWEEELGDDALQLEPDPDMDVCEVFSPPRLSKRARQLGYRGGWSLDLKCEDEWTKRKYNLLLPKVQKEVKHMLRRDRPRLLVVSPPSTLFSTTRRTGAISKVEWEQAVEMVRFGLELCLIQHRADRQFIFEHPASATSWNLMEMKEFLLHTSGVSTIMFDQCQFGLMSWDQMGCAPVYKPTRLIVNHPVMEEKLSKRCHGGHRHVMLEGGSRTRRAVEYPTGLCDAMLEGLDIIARWKHEQEVLGLEEDDMCEPDPGNLEEEWDDITGESLDVRLVKAARTEEIEYMNQIGAWRPVLRSEVMARNPEAKIVGTRWVQVNKGCKEKPDVRCRLVAQEFAHDKRDDLFAGTPPLAAARYVLSDCMSRGRSSFKRSVMVLDVKKAFLHGKMERELYIELPVEDPQRDNGQYIGRLVRALYGTRDAPLAWQRVVKKFMIERGFHHSHIAQGIYVHRARDLRIVCHVDDFLVTGPADQVEWFRSEMASAYEVKHQTLGWNYGDEEKVNFLGRMIRRTNKGLTIEGDDKHRVRLLEEWGMTYARQVGTPFVKHEVDPDALEMNKMDATRYRRAAARVTYMAQDRPDLCFAARALAGRMASPRVGDELGIKRVLRYLQKAPVALITYEAQEVDDVLRGFSDSDWAGDPHSRRSTSGGVVFRGLHAVHWWSQLQARVALSSCEAEVNALVKATSECLHVQRLGHAFGDPMRIMLFTDASAAKGSTLR